MVFGAVGLVDVLVVVGTTTLCSGAAAFRVGATIGIAEAGCLTMASNCLAILRWMGFRFFVGIVSSDAKSSSATKSACCGVGLSVGSLQCCGKNCADPLIHIPLVSGQ
jgi:hypothetical protein